MTSRSSVDEIQLPSILDDFEVGDRIVWRGKNSVVRFGTVVQMEDTFMFVSIVGFGGKPTRIRNTGNEDDNLFHIKQWKKMPDDKLIKAGDVLSTILPFYLSKPGQREYFTVLEIIPGYRLTLQNNADSNSQIGINGSNSLDEYLQYWELEG